jgi:hypothetical protein
MDVSALFLNRESLRKLILILGFFGILWGSPAKSSSHTGLMGVNPLGEPVEGATFESYSTVENSAGKERPVKGGRAMKDYIFGYGSIINLESAAKTLGRTVEDHEVLMVEARDFSRLWRVVVPVIVDGYGENPVNAVFLDIEKHQGKGVSGIIIQVTTDELKRLDIREKPYSRIDITPYIHPRVQDGRIFAYQGKPEFFVDNFDNPKVLTQYLNIVYKGLQHWGREFSDRFEETTQPHNFETIDGSYKFGDVEQNILTGRD